MGLMDALPQPLLRILEEDLHLLAQLLQAGACNLLGLAAHDIEKGLQQLCGAPLEFGQPQVNGKGSERGCLR